MRVVYNPSGTHINKGFLKVRMDFYPDPSDKTYTYYYIDEIDDKGLPTGKKQITYCLSNFVVMPELVNLAHLSEYMERYSKNTIATIDNALIQPNSIHLISPLMRPYAKFTNQKIQTKDINDLLNSVNLKLKDFQLDLGGGGTPIIIEPETIDVGAAAIDQASGTILTNTKIEGSNPVNANGTIDTVETWFDSNGANVEVALFSGGTGTGVKTVQTGSNAVIGTVTAGAKRTFASLTMVAVTGDLVGIYGTAGSIKRNNTGGLGILYNSGECIDDGDSATFTWTAGWVISLYGTGTEAGTVHQGSATLSGAGTVVEGAIAPRGWSSK